MMLTERLKKMMSPKGFDEVFDREVSRHRTKVMAFRALNEEYKEVFGEYRYKNYHSYRMSRTQRITVSSN